jgi:hypothetical protein
LHFARLGRAAAVSGKFAGGKPNTIGYLNECTPKRKNSHAQGVDRARSRGTGSRSETRRSQLLGLARLEPKNPAFSDCLPAKVSNSSTARRPRHLRSYSKRSECTGTRACIIPLRSASDCHCCSCRSPGHLFSTSHLLQRWCSHSVQAG